MNRIFRSHHYILAAALLLAAILPGCGKTCVRCRTAFYGVEAQTERCFSGFDKGEGKTQNYEKGCQDMAVEQDGTCVCTRYEE